MVRKSPKEANKVVIVESGNRSLEILRMLDQYADGILGEATACMSTEQRADVQKDQGQDKSEVPTAKVSPKKHPEVVVFKTNRETKKRRLSPQRDLMNARMSEQPDLKFDVNNGRLDSKEVLKKIQFDVTSCGMKSLSKEKQREQERQRAIRLGAKPSKNKTSMNYRLYIEERKRQIEAQSEGGTEPTQKKSKKNTGTSNLPQPKFWKEGNKSVLPQVGKFRGGVLKLSSKDIKSIKRQK